MKFSINANALQNALESTARVIQQKSASPAITCFLFQADGTDLTITGTDSVTTIQERLPCETLGEVLMPVNVLNLVRTLADEPLDIEVVGSTATIKWTNGESSMQVEDAKDYPLIPKMPEKDRVTMGGPAILSALSHTIPHCGFDELRPIMGGVFFKSKKGGVMDFVASDSHTLCLYRTTGEMNGEFNYVIPASAVKYVSSMAKMGDVELCEDGRNVFFRSGATVVVTRKIEGMFPNYESVIPKDSLFTLTVNRNALINSIMRVMVCSDAASKRVKLTLNPSESVIESQDLTRNTLSKETLQEASFDGNDFVIAFNGDFLLRCLRSIAGTEVRMSFTDSRHPALVTSKEDVAVMIAMPMQI